MLRSDSMRPPEPEFVRDWRERRIPRCCHTCDNYSDDGTCLVADERPPEDFAATRDICDSWVMEIPF